MIIIQIDPLAVILFRCYDASDEEIEAFCAEIKTVLKLSKLSDMNIIIGDFKSWERPKGRNVGVQTESCK